MPTPAALRKEVDKKHWSYINQGNELYIAGLDCNLAFTDKEIDTVINMWKQGCHVADIVEALKRPGIEVGFLIMDLAERCKLRPRKGGMVGVIK